MIDLGPLVYLLQKILFIWLSKLLFINGPDEVYSRNESRAIKFDIYLSLHIWQKSLK